MLGLSEKLLRRWLVFGWVIALILGWELSAQPPSVNDHEQVAQQIVREALTHQQAFRWLRELCAIGPRLSGSPPSYRAIEWAYQKLKSLGADTVYLQPVSVPRWIRGVTEMATVSHPPAMASRRLSISALGGSVGTLPEGISGEVIRLDSLEQVEQFGNRLRDKIVFFDASMPPEEVSTFRGYGKAVKHRLWGAARAARFGAKAVLIRSLTTRYDNVPHTGVTIYSDTIPPIPAVALGWQDSDWLTTALQQYPEIHLRLQLSAHRLPDTVSYNVVADLRGWEKPEEIVLVGAHLDSWDVGQGAHDDAAGCVQAMEALHLFKKLNLRPRRTIRCVLFMNEENGSRGAREYAWWSDSLQVTHVAAMESDRGGFTPRGFSISADSSTIATLQTWLPVLRLARIEWIRKGGSGADISRLKNCPVKIGYFPDDQRYFDVHHSANDVFETVHPRELELGSAAMAIFTYLLSEIDY